MNDITKKTLKIFMIGFLKSFALVGAILFAITLVSVLFTMCSPTVQSAVGLSIAVICVLLLVITLFFVAMDSWREIKADVVYDEEDDE
jgi:hypothetical protein